MWRTSLKNSATGGWIRIIRLIIAEQVFRRWFGGPDTVMPNWEWNRVEGTMWAVSFGFGWQGVVPEFECEDDCDGENAYTNTWYDDNIHLCPNYFSNSQNRRAGILLHETTHRYAGTDDFFYYSNATDPTSCGADCWREGNDLVKNADTYEGMYLDFLMGTVIKPF